MRYSVNVNNFLAILLVHVLVSGCVGTGQRAYPGDNYVAKPDEAVIIVGNVLSDSPVYKVSQIASPGRETEYAFGLDPNDYTNYAKMDRCVLIRASVGKPFKIDKAYVSRKSRRSVISHAKLQNPPVLTPTEPGIYYYATLGATDENVYLNEKQLPEVINCARTKYRGVFGALKPKNFQ